MSYSRVVILLALAALPAAASGIGIADPAYALLNNRIAQNGSQFYVYMDMDSGFNHGFPSGFYGVAGKLQIDPGCVYDHTAANGCSTDPTALDRTRGTVFRFTFAALAAGQYTGVNFEEPQNWGVNPRGVGYNLTGATQLVFDAVSPTGGIAVQLSVNGATSQYMTFTNNWQTYTINLSSLTPATSSLSNVHLLFGVASNDLNAPNGGTVLLDNIHFLPVPTGQAAVPALPLANQVFGILHVPAALGTNIPIPPDQIDSNLATLYESSLAALALLGRGQTQDLANAKPVADALVYALQHDNRGDPLPAAPDGSTGLHSGYSNGDLPLLNGQGSGQQGQVRLAGYSAAQQCQATGYCLSLDGATGGNDAFAILALVAAYTQFQDSNYLNAAITVGGWIYGNLADASGAGYGGYFVGYPDQGLPKVLQTGKSTENNADIFAAFTALANAETLAGNSAAAAIWTARANMAGDFVMQMYDPSTGHFFAGTVPLTQSAGPGIYPTGSVKGTDVINTFDFLDAQTFTTLAMARAARYRNQIDWRLPVQWLLTAFPVSVSAGSATYSGFDLIEAAEHLSSDGPAGVAWEFTGQAVAAMQFVDALYGAAQFATQAASYLNQVRQAQTSAPFADGQGIVAATLQNGDALAPYRQCLVTPYQCIAERTGLAATIWGLAADQGLNPLAPTSVLQIAKGHTRNFSQGQTGAAYTVTVSNAAGAAPAMGAVTVTETMPGGLTPVSMTGGGWTCGPAACTRGDSLSPGSSFPAITVTVNVNSGSPSLVTNQVTVSGGGSANAVSSDPTSTMGPCDIDGSGAVNVVDVQRIINEALGVAAAVDDLNGDGAVNVVDVQIVINSALGLGCTAK